MARLEPRDHTISLNIAAEYTRRHRASGAMGLEAAGGKGGKARPGANAGAFHADQVMKLLQQNGCVALRIYHGATAKDDRAMILVGVDGTGNDMTTGIMMEMCWPCPPFCSDSNVLNS